MKRQWTVWLAIILAVPAFVLSGVTGLNLARLFMGKPNLLTDSETLHPLEMAGMVIASQFSLAMIAFIAASLSPISWRLRLGLRRGRWTWYEKMAVAAATPAIGMATTWLMQGWIEPSEHLVETDAQLRQLLADGYITPMLLIIGLLPAVCEEIFFRGYVQQRLVRFWPPTVGIIISSMMFSLFHFDPVHIMAIFPVGYWLSLIAYRSRSIQTAMLGHLLNNVTSVLLATETEQHLFALPPLPQTVLIMLCGALGVFVLNRTSYTGLRNTKLAIETME